MIHGARATLAVALRMAAWLATAFMLLAGISKCIDQNSFRAAMATWTVLPEWSIDPLAIFVPALEIGLAMLWLLGLSRFVVGMCLGTLLLTFASFYAIELARGGTPKCGCISQIMLMKQLNAEGHWVIARNLTLAGSFFAGSRWPRCQLERTELPQPSPAATRGFTLIETLVVISIIAVLIALAMPALSKMRARAQYSKSLANLRTHVQAITAYTIDWKDSHPHFADPTRAKSSFHSACFDDGEGTIYYFNQAETWHLVLGPTYYGGCGSSAFIAPELLAQGQRSGSISQYIFACVFQAAPEFWRRSTQVGPSQWRNTRSHEVSFPDKRSLIWASHPWDYQFTLENIPKSRLGFVDGSAADVPSLLGGRDEFSGCAGPYEGGVHSGATYAPAMHSLDGVRGRDR